MKVEGRGKSQYSQRAENRREVFLATDLIEPKWENAITPIRVINSRQATNHANLHIDLQAFRNLYPRNKESIHF